MKARKRILVLADTFDEFCQYSILSGITETARGKPFDIITLPLAYLGKKDDVQTHYFFLKDHLEKEIFDAVILFTGGLTEHTSEVTLKALLSHTELPIVSVAGELKRDSDILVDNRTGIIDLVDHFVTVHEVQRIAFIGGPRSNKEAKERLAGYVDGLEKNGILYDESLVFTGSFSRESGIKATVQLINNSCLFDSIICADDYTAMGAIEELNRRGIAVPGDVLVAGFDNSAESAVFSPALTTIGQPFRAMGVKALSVVEDIIHYNRTVENSYVLETKAVFRDSCSCDTSSIDSLLTHLDEIHKAFEHKEKCDDELFMAIIQPSVEEAMIAFPLVKESDRDEYLTFIQLNLAYIWNSFSLAEKGFGTKEDFLHTFAGILNNQTRYFQHYDIWEYVLVILAAIVDRYFNDSYDRESLNEMILEARSLYEQQLVKSDRQKILVQNRVNTDLRESLTHLVHCESKRELLQLLQKEYTPSQFPVLTVALYDAPIKEEFAQQEVLLHIINGKDEGVASGELRYRSSAILVEKMKDSLPQNSLWLPLAFRDLYFGYIFVAVEESVPRFFYEELRNYLSLTLSMLL